MTQDLATAPPQGQPDTPSANEGAPTPRSARAHAAQPRARTRKGSRTGPRAAAATKSWVLGIAGTAGALTMVTALTLWMLGLTIVVLQTGSMAPTMPAGTAALVHTVPAEQLSVGDVVTVQRPDQAMPVTHRVIGTTPTADGVSLRLQGDANAVPDFEPYVVDEAALVVFSLPEVGFALQTLRTPFALGLMTLAVAALVAWAFWPAPRRQKR